MAEKKNQHYVPQMYLRSFSINQNGAQIGMYNLKHDLYIANTSIKHQAKADYFYGADGRVENALGETETNAGPILQAILSGNSIPPKSSKAYVDLFAFLLILAFRTKDTVEQINENINKALQHILQYSKFKDVAKDYEISLKEPAAIAVKMVVERIPDAMDLQIKIVKNTSKLSLLTSDNPAILYNQFLAGRGWRSSTTGILTMGLQIFIPISPDYLIVLYDDQIYKVGDKKKHIIEMPNERDIQLLNRFQYLNSHEALYFNQTIRNQYVNKIVRENSDKRRTEYSHLSEHFNGYDKRGNESRLMWIQNHDHPSDLDLSFIAQTKRAKTQILNNYAVQLRNEALRGK